MFFKLPEEIIKKIFLFDRTYHELYIKLLNEFHFKTPHWYFSLKNFNNEEYIKSSNFNINLNKIVSNSYISTTWLEYYSKTYPEFYGMENIKIDLSYISDNDSLQPLLKKYNIN